MTLIWVRKLRYKKVQRLPLDQGEPSLCDANDPCENEHNFDPWAQEEREKWQLHSALGPNLNPEGFVYQKEALDEVTTEKLDEYQLFFVSLVLEHVDKILEAWNSETKEPEPLRLMLLGTAGTGKSTATKTMLQELRRRLRKHGLS